jgi:trehalose 6-phosphate synthase/phosphatase
MLIRAGSFIETKKIALTWHYRRADPEYGEFQARQCKRELEHGVCRKWDVEVMAGKANLEVRPRFVNKGEIARQLVEEVGKDGELEFVLCLGDDYTDEGTLYITGGRC